MKIICIGRNYAEHAKELGNEVPEEPVIFMKPKNALLSPNAPFYYPDFTNELHYECELVIRIGRNGKFISERNALDYVNGYTVGIDFTARDVQNLCKRKGLPWEKAKAFDNSAVIGKIRDFSRENLEQPIDFSMKLNEELVQAGDTSQMLFSIPSLIRHITQYFTINIGDLIFTGTPPGVGECVVGDELECFLEGDSLISLLIK